MTTRVVTLAWWCLVLACAGCLGSSIPLAAQPVPLVDPRPPVNAITQRVADRVSDVTLAAALSRATWDAWHASDRRQALIRLGVGTGTTWAGVTLLQHAIGRARPCSPPCARTSFPSAHAALACTTTGASLQWTVPLASGTMVGRWLAWKHWPTDLAAGCALGWAAGRWIRTSPHGP